MGSIGLEEATESEVGSEFRVRLCLRRYYGDERARAYVQVCARRRVRWLARRARALAGGAGRVRLVTRGHWLPPDEPLSLLQHDDLVEVIPITAECNGDSVSQSCVVECVEPKLTKRKRCDVVDSEGDCSEREGATSAAGEATPPSPAADRKESERVMTGEESEAETDLATDGDNNSTTLRVATTEWHELEDARRQALAMLDTYASAAASRPPTPVPPTPVPPTSVPAPPRARRRVRRRRPRPAPPAVIHNSSAAARAPRLVRPLSPAHLPLPDAVLPYPA